MDNTSQERCEGSPTPSGHEGCAGGPVPAGGNEILGGETPPVPTIKVGDIVYLRWKGELLRCRTEALQEFGGAINVSNGNGEYICERKDLITEAEHLANVFEENKLAAARQNSRVLDAYPLIPATITKTAKRNKWLADLCGMTARDVAGAVRSLAHWKLIELPKEKVKETPEYRALLDELLKHRFRYYVLSRPTVDDYEYDQLERKLIDMEEAGQTPDPHSPSQVVGGDGADGYPQHIQDFFK